MSRGKVKWYNEVKGYGFIETEDSKDVFVHRTGLNSTHDRLQPEQEVVFETREGEKGLYATNVKSANE